MATYRVIDKTTGAVLDQFEARDRDEAKTIGRGIASGVIAVFGLLVEIDDGGWEEF